MDDTEVLCRAIKAAAKAPAGQTVAVSVKDLGALLGLAVTTTRERDEARAEAADLRATVDTMQVQLDAHREWLATAQATGDEARAEVERLRRALEEREHDMHLRIRAGYDRTIADSWRAEVGRAVAAERELCAALCDEYVVDARAIAARCDGRFPATAESARIRAEAAEILGAAIRARGAGGAR